MATVKIIIRGSRDRDYANSVKRAEKSDACVTTLIRDGKSIIVVDPGIMDSQQILIDALKAEDLTVDQVTHVFITHSHLDHYRNVGMFPATTKVVEYWGEWTGEHFEKQDEQFSDDIKIINTPGHSYDSLTFLVSTSDGVVAIAGDVFWKENYPEIDPYASDLDLLKKTREHVLKNADFIIPGHGKMYKVKK